MLVKEIDATCSNSEGESNYALGELGSHILKDSPEPLQLKA